MRIIRHLIVLIGFSLISPWAHAGAYEDFLAALRVDDGKAVARLLSRGLDPNTPNEKGDPALVAALRDGQLAVADALLQHPDLKIDQPNGSNETALMMASLRGRTDWVQRLIQRGAAVNRRGWAPIHYAATGQDAMTVHMLAKAGADLRAPNPSGSTALHMAARFGSEDVVMALIDLGLDPRERNPGGQDAADAARWAGRDSLASRLERLGPGLRR